MLRTIVIGAPPEVAAELGRSLDASGQFALLRSVDRYPPPQELGRMLRAYAPQVILLCADRLGETLEAASAIEEAVPGLPVVAFGSHVEPRTLLELMKAGIRDYLPPPFEPHSVTELARRLRERLAKNPVSFALSDLVFAFLPAKAGVGASTIAMNLAMALSRQPNKRVLLADFDLNSGLIGFMLKIAGTYSLVDAAEMSAQLDDSLWGKLVQGKDNLHVLPAGRPDPGMRIEPAQIQRLLAFARRLYHVICADLSGNLEKYSIELMHEAKRIFLVTTPEIPPLHLARERLRLLRQLELGDRVSILVNRYHRASAISIRQIEDVLEAPVYASFANSYRSVHQALVEGRPVEENSELGRQILELAKRILDPGAQQAQPAPKRFIEYFAVLHPKFSLREQ
jgi:pilus assembly protein CpaE